MRKIALIGPRKRSSENETPPELSDSEQDLLRINSAGSASPISSQYDAGSPLWRQNSIANSSLTRSKTRTDVASHNQAPDHLGLQLLCDNAEPAGDIIFVHGLGGTAMRTWSWRRDVAYFWPAWLADDKVLSSFRIFVFGYNSNFKGGATNLNITDFAKALLFSMLTFSGGLREGSKDHIPIGTRPVIFVAHSMGGLVVKKAYILGKHDKQYSSLVARVYGILFLATPHRGAQYAKMVNNILSIAPFVTAPKAYVAELDIQSGSLQDINELFRHYHKELQLASFFETKKTSFGVKKILIVEKESGILGYPEEMSAPLDADHHSICKFEGPGDPNYVTVRNLLIHWASGLQKLRPSITKRQNSSSIEIKKLEIALGIRDSAEIDLSILRNQVLNGTCRWIITRLDFVTWLESVPTVAPKLFWLVGLPGTGKTALARSVIEHLKFRDQECAYHFFSSGHQLKRTAVYCLRSITFQLAQVNLEFREQLSSLLEESSIQFDSLIQSFSLMWEKVFEGILFKLTLRKPLFLVLDGIDEADSPALVQCIMKMQSLVPIKVFLTSRPVKIPSASVVNSLTTCFLNEEDTIDDIRAYVRSVVSNALPDDPTFQEDIINQILAKASGSFLWVKLALETLQDNWHTRNDIQNALTEVSKGMESLYEQMLDKVKAQSTRLRLMAKRILTWAICCWRPLSIAELQMALQPEFEGFVRLEDTIVQICGHFISVDNSKITLVHATARSFLLNGKGSSPPFINSHEGHEHIALICLNEADPILGANGPSVLEKNHSLFRYAALYWAYHVSNSSSNSEDLKATLTTFLKKFFLSWVEYIATLGNLRHLTRSAQYIKAYTERRNATNLLGPCDPLSDKNDPRIFESWANDFIHIVGKFGRNLIQRPSSIYWLIPPFCPQQSMVGSSYRVIDSNTVSVAGLSPEGWGDRLASVNVGDEAIASKILATEEYFITLISRNGSVVLWYSETCEEAKRIHHNEYVPIMVLNRAGTRLATAGISTYRIWDLSSGKELYCLPKLTEGYTKAISFGQIDSEFVVGLDDCSVTIYNLETLSIKSHWVARDSLLEVRGCPSVMAISPDLNKVAIAWRGNPLMIWDITQSLPPRRCRVSGSSDPLNAPELVKWQTDGNSILILCFGTEIVEWKLYDDEQTEFGKYYDTNAREMSISADGKLLITSDSVGTMSVWMFPKLQLIYRLTNEHGLIRDIAFSPNGQRFYDIRESTCNVWAPDSLVRPEKQNLEDVSNMVEVSEVAEPVISHDESSDNQVTAFAPSSNDMYYCCGKEDGTVAIHEAIKGARVRKVYGYAATSTVLSVAWSQSGRYIVSNDDSGRVISKRLEIKEVSKWAVFPVLDIRIRETVQQFVFSNDEKLLLISTLSKDFVWDLKGKKEICSTHHKEPHRGKWVADPMDAEVILLVCHDMVYPYKWTTLEPNDTTHLPATTVDPPNDIGFTVRKLTATKDKKNLVYETLPPRPSSDLQISALSTITRTNSSKVEFSFPVKSLIGTFQDRIVFLDCDYWVCTLKIDAESSDIRRHFFLPKDWINTSNLHMAAITDHGTFYCPTFGRVVIVRNGIRI